MYSVICICVVWVGDVITNSIWRQSDQSCFFFFCFLQGKYSNWHLWKSMNGVCGNLIFAKNGSAAVLAACRRSERFFKIRIIFGYDAGSGIKTCNIYKWKMKITLTLHFLTVPIYLRLENVAYCCTLSCLHFWVKCGSRLSRNFPKENLFRPE